MNRLPFLISAPGLSFIEGECCEPPRNNKLTMIDEKRSRKESVLYDLYKEFAENTSIHGLKYTVKSGIALYEKVFWLLVVLAGLGGAGYMTVLFWNRYTSNPTRTSIMTAYAPTTAVPFPAITICNINRIMKDQIDEFVDMLNIPEDDFETVRRAFPQLLSFSNTDTRKYNMTDLLVLQRVLSQNSFDNIQLVMKRITQPCRELFLKCTWEFQTVPCDEIFKERFTLDGLCCSFNYIDGNKDNRLPTYTAFSGMNSGLRLHLDPKIQDVQYSSLHSSGLKVMVHDPWDYPNSGSIYKIVSAGRQTYLQVSASRIDSSDDIRKLSIEQRQCVYAEEVKLKYFQLYTDTNCLTECEEEYLYKKCGCVPLYYSFTTRMICGVRDIPCLDEYLGASLTNITKSCNCPSGCEDVFYSVLASSVSLMPDESAHHTFLQNKKVSNDDILLYIYFGTQRQTILYIDTITSTIYLLSSFGGVYSLFLGCSFITIVEIVYYISVRLIVTMKLVGRIDKNVPKIPKPKREEPREKLWTHEGIIYLN